MTRLPDVLAAKFNADYVEDVPYDVRMDAWDRITRMNINAEKFPHADWGALDAQEEAMQVVAEAWLDSSI